VTRKPSGNACGVENASLYTGDVTDGKIVWMVVMNKTVIQHFPFPPPLYPPLDLLVIRSMTLHATMVNASQFGGYVTELLIAKMVRMKKIAQLLNHQFSQLNDQIDGLQLLAVILKWVTSCVVMEAAFDWNIVVMVRLTVRTEVMRRTVPPLRILDMAVMTIVTSAAMMEIVYHSNMFVMV